MKVNILKKIDKKTSEAISLCMQIADLYGFEIYLVGGIVRDILLHKPLKDVDITVAGDAKAFVKIIGAHARVKSVRYNETLPTAKIVFKNGVEIDFASTRQELYEISGELPKIVTTGCSLEKDVQRRDFTVNAVALSLNRENLFEIIDFLGGVGDLKSKKLKVLHKKSFTDDPSRMIRGLKFAQRLDFSLDSEALELQNKYLSHPLSDIPLERVKNEIKELFSLNKNSAFDDFLKFGLYKIFAGEVFQGLSSEKIRAALFEFAIKDEDIWLLYFLPLFIVKNPPEKINLSLRELKIIKDLQSFVKNPPVLQDDYAVFEYFNAKDYLTAVFFGIFNDIEKAKRFFKIKHTKVEITGFDLQALGVKQGKIYSEIQKAILKEKLNNDLKGKEKELNFVKEYIKQYHL